MAGGNERSIPNQLQNRHQIFTQERYQFDENMRSVLMTAK